MAKSIIQYRPTALSMGRHKDLPGISTFSYFGKYFTFGFSPTDRTGTIRMPVLTKSIFPIPEFRPFNKTFEDICNDRAKEILASAEKMSAPLLTFWSGGIDSTLVLISLLKSATPEQKKNITVMMTEESIGENPRFYEEHIYGKLRTDSAMMFPSLLGGKALMTNGEQNDQLFGSDSVGKLMRRFGQTIVHAPYQRETMFIFFNEQAGNEKITNRYLDLFERLMERAPMPIVTHLEYLWWFNFSMKWQNAFMRMLTCTPARNVASVTPEYVRTKYVSFYGTDDFQLWSMNNTDKRIKDEWRSYKWPCKDIIYEYTKDADYRDNKTKQGSLRHVIVQQDSFGFIDEDFKFYDDLDVKEFYNPENDFV